MDNIKIKSDSADKTIIDNPWGRLEKIPNIIIGPIRAVPEKLNGPTAPIHQNSIMKKPMPIMQTAKSQI